MTVYYDGAHGFTAETRSLQGQTATVTAADMGTDLHINIVHGRSLVLDPAAARELAQALVWWADRRERVTGAVEAADLLALIEEGA